MDMDYLISMLLFLFTFFSFNPASSYASQLSYKDHCASFVPDSTPNNHRLNSFPLGDHHGGYYTGGDRIMGVGASWQEFSFYLKPRNIRATQASGLFKIESIISFKSTNTWNLSYGDRLNYGHPRGHHGDHVTFKLDGFWSESSGNVCLVGTGSGYSKTGNSLKLDAVFKLNNVFKSSNISSLVSGSLESLSSEDDENYFEPISVFMFPKENYSYTLDSIEVDNECFSGSDAEQGLSLDLNSLSFCSYPLSRAIRTLQLEYSSDCSSFKNCTPISGSSGQLPPLMSLKGIECSHTKKHGLRFLVEFLNNSYYEIYRGFNPKTMLVGEGWWDKEKNIFCAVACHIMGTESSTHVGDCSVRLRLRFPSIWSINDTSSTVGEIWSNKTAKDPGYFKKITFRNDNPLVVGGHGLKYEYSQLDKVNKPCQTPKPVKDQAKTYPNADSYDMRFDMSVRESKRRIAWGYSVPLTVDDQFNEVGVHRFYDSFSSSVIGTPDEILNNNNGSLFNISYKISISLMSNSKLYDRNSLFNKSSEMVKISAEGIYDAGAGTLCMAGCRNLPQNNGIPIAHSVDCEILVKFQFPPLDASDGSRIKGSIESTRPKTDPLYFKRLELSATSYYLRAAERNVWRMDMEVTMALISTTLACVSVGLQLYHVKRKPDVLPFVSLVMMSILTLGHMIPLVLNFEALFTQNRQESFAIRYVRWLEVDEISVRLITMVAFWLQFRLMYLTCSSRMTDESKKGLWVAERKAACVTLPLYAAGLLSALLLKFKSWENFKSFGGLVLDGFLLPQIILNLFSNMRENVLSCSFYFGTTLVRLLPHAYDLYRTHNYVSQDESYFYADPNADFYSTAWDIVIPLGGILFAIIIYLQQRFGAHYILPRRFKGSKVYEKVPVATESEAEVETANM